MKQLTGMKEQVQVLGNGIVSSSVVQGRRGAVHHVMWQSIGGAKWQGHRGCVGASRTRWSHSVRVARSEVLELEGCGSR